MTEARELPLQTPRDDHRFELPALGPMGRDDPHGVRPAILEAAQMLDTNRTLLMQLEGEVAELNEARHEQTRLKGEIETARLRLARGGRGSRIVARCLRRSVK